LREFHVGQCFYAHEYQKEISSSNFFSPPRSGTDRVQRLIAVPRWWRSAG